MKKLAWIAALLVVIAGLIFFSYSYLFAPAPLPETNESDPNSLFAGDSTNLDWLNDPEIPAEPIEDMTEMSETEQEHSEAPGEKQPSTDQAMPTDQATPSAQPDSINPSSSTAAVVSETSIAMKYKGQFQALERSYQGKLKGMINQAKRDYIAIQKGESDQSKFGLASKYLSKANQLESTADGQFYKLLGKMEQELIDAGLSTDLVKLAENEYKARKKNQKAALMQKFTDNM